VSIDKSTHSPFWQLTEAHNGGLGVGLGRKLRDSDRKEVVGTGSGEVNGVLVNEGLGKLVLVVTISVGEENEEI